MMRLLALVWLLVCLGFGSATGQTVRPSDEVEPKELSLDERRLKLEEARFAFDQKKYERDRGLEWGKAWAAIGSVLVTLGVGLSAYIFQVRARRPDEALQFQLKAAEIVMDARDTNQASRKAEFLTKLFPGRLDLLETALKAQPPPPVPGVGPGALADATGFLTQLPDAGIHAHVETEELGFDFNEFELAWEVLAGVTTAQLAPERRQEAKAAVQGVMRPGGRGPREFRNVTQFLVGRAVE